jgi:voltage-gated potassium channel
LTSRGERLDRWSAATEAPLLVLALIYLVAWSFIVLWPNDDYNTLFLAVMIVVWLLFAADYVIKIVLAERRAEYAAHHVPDLIAVILPFLRPVVQLTHQNSIFFRRQTGAPQRTRIVMLATAFAVLFVYSMALAVYDVEHEVPGATMKSFGDALWWACVTLFTVGYGDITPVTVPGRLYAVMLMVGGIAIIGTASAVVVSYLNERVRSRAGAAGDPMESNELDLDPKPEVER